MIHKNILITFLFTFASMEIKTNLLREIKRQYLKELETVYDKQEANSLLNILIKHFFGLSRVDQAVQTDFRLSESEILKLHFAVKDLKNEKPVQYITGETEFQGLKLKVTPDVLIPRPETEELIDLIVKENTSRKINSILDIGTGSGCIALSLKKYFPESEVTGIDISENSLKIANENSELNGLQVNFVKADILDSNVKNKFEKFDLIVSNPPYVTEDDKILMKKNVLEFEPHLALFVENNEPLVFYEKIADFSVEKLNPDGQLWFEVNEKYGYEVSGLLKHKGFKNVTVIKDFMGKERFVFCKK